MEEQLALNPCQAFGCAEVVDRCCVFCDRHALMLSSDTYTRVARTYRPGKPASKAFLAALIDARVEIQYVEAVGHRPPQEARFEW